MAVNSNLNVVMNMASTSAGALGGVDSFPSGMSHNSSRHAGSSPVADVGYAGTFALSGGAVTIDLEALAQSSGRDDLDLTDQIIYTVAIRNNGANPMTFTEGSTDGFAFEAVVPGNGIAVIDGNGGLGTVATADSQIDVSGTGTETFDLILITGPSA